MRIRTSDAGADQTLDASSKEKYQSQKADHHGEWRQFISGNGYREAIFEAASRGHFSTVKWLYEEADQSQQKAVYQIIFNGASVNCHLDILKWLKNINTAFFKAGIDQPNEAACKFIINAFRAGRRDILDWFQNETRNEDWGITAVHPY